MKTSEQPTMFELPPKVDTVRNQKRRWENAFQKWSDEQSQDGTTPEGCCGYGMLCDWCEDNSYGRPCIRAFNAMCREKHVTPDYQEYDFEKYWYWRGDK
jgi:hypothetical protein